MGWITGTAVYFILWWLVLFMVLPFGVRRHEDHGQGHDAGAPAKPLILVKVVATTGIAFALWLIVYFIERYDLISFSAS